ncbi:MAG: hypothetical protein QOD72_2617 [Acidimicrobiaceae bacterium]|nr:hypothetical protein [Acidimicrobiaceae bacterium]
MKVAYLVLAHTAPAHLSRLIAALSSESSTIFVHVDQKSDLDAFRHLAPPNVEFTQERVRVEWGHFSQVEAALVLLRAGVADPRRFDRFVLISGVDYPLRSVSYIAHFFALHPDWEFIDLFPMPDDAAGKPITRLTTYQLRPRHGRLGKPTRRLLMGVFRRLHRRNYEARLGGLAPYGGATWWALSRAAAQHILMFTRDQPAIVRFFRHTLNPDESYFQTILGNSPFRANVHKNLTYVDWSGGGANPGMITEAHVEMFATLDQRPPNVAGAHERLFARKFSDDGDRIIARLDRVIEERERSGANPGGRTPGRAAQRQDG